MTVPPRPRGRVPPCARARSRLGEGRVGSAASTEGRYRDGWGHGLAKKPSPCARRRSCHGRTWRARRGWSRLAGRLVQPPRRSERRPPASSTAPGRNRGAAPAKSAPPGEAGRAIAVILNPDAGRGHRHPEQRPLQRQRAPRTSQQHRALRVRVSQTAAAVGSGARRHRQHGDGAGRTTTPWDRGLRGPRASVACQVVVARLQRDLRRGAGGLGGLLGGCVVSRRDL
jgi:hypothetical protein